MTKGSAAVSAVPPRSATTVDGSLTSETDVDYKRRFDTDVLLPMADTFFEARVESEDILRRAVADGRQIILVGNHSGGSMSWDNVILQAVFDRATGDREPQLRRLIHPRLYRDNIAPFCIPGWWRRMGCVEATYDNFDSLLAQGERFVYLSPEGVDGLKKPTWRSRELLPFSSSFVSVAKRYNAIVLPVAIHNSQYLNPLSCTSRRLDRIAERLLGWPFLPVGPAVPLILLAKFFIQAWPTRLVYEILQPMQFDGPDVLVRNRHDAQTVKFKIEDSLAQRRTSIRRATHWRAFLNTPITFWNTYRHFFEAHAGRRMRRRERAAYLLPVFGYACVRRSARSAVSKGRVRPCAV